MILIITLTKFVIYKALFKIKTEEIPIFFASSEKSHLSVHVMAHTVLLNCLIKAEIRAVDS